MGLVVTRGSLLGLALACAAGGSLAQPLPYGLGSWPEAGCGNHRAVLHVAEPAEAVWAHIEWRRRDPRPETKDMRVYDATTGQRVLNVVRVEVNREYGDLAFQPPTAPGDYYVYYLPYDPPGTGVFGATGDYFPPEDTADPTWLQAHGLNAETLAAGAWRALPQAQVVEIQARSEFQRMDPMEVIATREEVERLLAAHPDEPCLLFPEDRGHPIRMFEDLPYRWIERGPSNRFEGQAQPGEFYVFQIGVFAAGSSPISFGKAEFADLRSDGGSTIPASALTCFNLEGTNSLGQPMARTSGFSLGEGEVRPLWFGVQVPRDAKGTYRGTIMLPLRRDEPRRVEVALEVGGPVLEDAGDGDLWRLSRLRWLNSTLGQEDEVVPPFTPLEVRGNTIRMLGREVVFGDSGLPERIRSNGRDVLAGPMALTIETANGPVQWATRGPRGMQRNEAVVERYGSMRDRRVRAFVKSKTEFDGCLTFDVTVQPDTEVAAKDIRLDIPLARDVAQYMMGMGKRGGTRPAEWHWQWDIGQADNMVWLGSVEAGLQLKLEGERDTWETRDLRQSGLPRSWWNEGHGRCDITEEGDRVLLRVSTGPRTLVHIGGPGTYGAPLRFRFRLLITPFKPVDPDHWNWRYGDTNTSGNVYHLHHGTPQNPYINYPFLKIPELQALVAQVKAEHTYRTDFGALTYPAAGNINPQRGVLHVWGRVNFDPAAGGPGQAQYNQGLFSLDYTNQDSVGFYWNIDDRGMRAYLRQGPPQQNRYPVLFATHQPDWQAGQRHVLTLSWGDSLAVFVDGQPQQAVPWAGLLQTPLAGATMRFSGGFALDAVKITDEPYVAGAAVSPTADDHTLLLDTFADWDGGSRTRPEVAKGGEGGTIAGVRERARGERDAELVFSSRETASGPKGLNIYYTTGQVSNHVVEMWPLRSLGDEVFRTGGVDVYTEPDATGRAPAGYPWLREHLVAGCEPAWRNQLPDGDIDAAIVQQGTSRWNNYYVEGLRWLMENTGVDGIYLDGIGYDRTTMKRVARVMHGAAAAPRINFHSGDNWAPPWDQPAHLSAANQYMEHFPYLSNLWFGELFDYDMPPDYWLVEISGLPFGLTGEMLNYENGGNPYRGMVYGMTGRQHPSAPAMWAFWDEFGIQKATMLGYWDATCPVRTDRPDVLATVYRKPHEALIALAHWPKEAGRLQATAGPLRQPPQVDGRLEAGEWDGAAKLTAFHLLGSQTPPAEPMAAYVTQDGKRLCFGFHCTQTGGAPRALVTRRDGDVWTDDAVELFIQPDPAQPRYLQFIGNSAGVFADAQGMDMTWNGDWEYRATVGEGFWEGEAIIPWDALRPLGGLDQIGFNVCRDRQVPTNELSCWALVRGSFHDPAHLGVLTFTPMAPPTVEPDAGVAAGEPPPVPVRLQIDWDALGLDRRRATLTAPPIEYFQNAATFAPGEAIPVEQAKGWLVVAGER